MADTDLRPFTFLYDEDGERHHAGIERYPNGQYGLTDTAIAKVQVFEDRAAAIAGYVRWVEDILSDELPR